MKAPTTRLCWSCIWLMMAITGALLVASDIVAGRMGTETLLATFGAAACFHHFIYARRGM